MKTLICIFVVVLSACSEEAQGKAGFFFGPSAKVSQLHEQSAVWLGGQVGWLFDGGAAIGGALYSLANGQHVSGYEQYPPHIGITYFGVLMSFAPDWHTPVQPMLDLLWGRGSMNPKYAPGDPDILGEGESSGFMVFEPTASLQYNIGRHVRAAGGIGARFTSGLYIHGYTDDDLNKLTWTVTVRVVDL